MRLLTPATALTTLVLAACASTPDGASLGPVDDDGFVARAGQDVYHVKSGLYCPSELAGMLRNRVSVFRKDIDIACNYKGPRQEMTVYLYPDNRSTDVLLPEVTDAAARGNLGNRIAPSDTLTEACRTQAIARSMVSQPMQGMASGESDIQVTVDDMGGAPGFPYRVGALEGGGARSYAALVPRSNGQMLKLRYSVFAEDGDGGGQADCERLYDAARTIYSSIGKPDGADDQDGTDALMQLLSQSAAQDS